MSKLESNQKAKLKQARKKIPYARGYHAPTEKEKVLAVGFTAMKKLPVEYSDESQPDKIFFNPIPEPTSIDDWLAQYVEKGQTFRQYLKENPWFSRRKQKFMRQKFVPSGNTLCEKFPEGSVYIAKLGEFSNNNISFHSLLDYIKRFLCLPVKVLEGLDIEIKNKDLIFVENPAFKSSSRSSARIKRSSLQTRYSSKTDHIQIGVDSLLLKLCCIIPDDALCFICLTPYDLYGDEPDLFVAGMAAGNKRVAVFSLLRYNPTLSFSQEHWYDIKENTSVTPDDKQRLMLQRSCKLVVHEICHLLGLPHCIYYSCCLNGSGHLKEDFDQPMMLCPVDLHKLQALIGFDVTERYTSLLDFYKQHNFQEEADWTERRLHFLKTVKCASSSTAI